MGFLDFLNPINLATKIGATVGRKAVGAPPSVEDVNVTLPTRIPSAQEVTSFSMKTANDIISGAGQAARGFAQGVEQIPSGVGGGMEVLGRAMQFMDKVPLKPVFKAATSVLAPMQSSFINPITQAKAPNVSIKLPDFAKGAIKSVGGEITLWGKTAKDFWNEQSNKGWESEKNFAFEDRPVLATIRGAFQSAPLMLASMGVTAATGSPLAGAMLFFPSASSNTYDNLMKQGVPETDAIKGALIDATQQVILENLFLSTWMGNWAKGKNFAVRAATMALAEGPVEEGSQGLASNIINELLVNAQQEGYDIKEEWKSGRLQKRLTSGLLQQALAGALMGGVTGGMPAGARAPRVMPEFLAEQNAARLRTLEKKAAGTDVSTLQPYSRPLTQQEQQEMVDLQRQQKTTAVRKTAPWVQAAVDKALGKDVQTFNIEEGAEGVMSPKAEEQFNQAHPIEYKKGDYPEGVTDSHRTNLDLFGDFYTPNHELKGQNRVWAAKALKRVRENIDTLLIQYENSPALKGKKNLVNTDIFRELFADEGYNKINSNAFHEAASALSKVYLERLLQEGRAKGNNRILFLSGAAGAGKTTGLTALKDVKTDTYAAVVDGTLSGYEQGTKLAKLNKLAKDGFDVNIVYTFRDPANAWRDGVIKRIIGGSDPRAIVLKNFLKDSRNLIENITKHADNPNLKLFIIDNSLGRDRQEVITPKVFKERIQNRFLKHGDAYWNDLQKELIDETEKLYEGGKLTREYRDALLQGMEQKQQGRQRVGDGGKQNKAATKEEVSLEEVGAEQLNRGRPFEYQVSDEQKAKAAIRERDTIPPAGQWNDSRWGANRRIYRAKDGSVYVMLRGESPYQHDRTKGFELYKDGELISRTPRTYVSVKDAMAQVEKIANNEASALWSQPTTSGGEYIGKPLATRMEDLKYRRLKSRQEVGTEQMRASTPKEGDTESLSAKKYEDVSRPTDEPSAILQGILDANKDKVVWDETGAPFVKKNMDIYEETVDPDTECPRWKDFSQLVKDVELRTGRKVTQEEYHNLRAYAKANGAVVPCPFCYTATHRTIGAMANKARGQSVYKGKILAWAQEKIDRINAHAGLRWFSNTDYKPSHTPDLIRVLWDMETRGLKGHAYTKQINFVDIFGDTGIKINMSIGGDVKGGQLVENTDLGIPWDDAIPRRDMYKNVGTVYVAKSDEEILKALDADFIDHIIPVHASGQSKAILQKYGALKDYTKEQSEIYKATGKKYESKVPDSVHNGDKQAYLDWCEKNGLIPKFQQFVGHPNYMKLVGPEAGKFNDNTQDVVDSSKIDYAKAEEVMGKWASGEGAAYPVTALEAMTATGLTPSDQTIEQQKLFKSEADDAFGSVEILENVITRVANNSQVNGNKIGEGVFKRRKIAEQLRKRGYINHIGLKLENEGDAAELASIFRHPTIERLQVIYVKDGVVLSHEVLSSGSPDCVNLTHRQQAEMAVRARKLGADKVWLAHNHPSGNFDPSLGDKAVSARMARTEGVKDSRGRLGSLFAGHIVLNHQSYSTIYVNQQGGMIIVTNKYKGGAKPIYTKGSIHKMLPNIRIQGFTATRMAGKIAILGKDFVANGMNSIVFLDGAMRVVAIDNLKYEKNLNAYINNRMGFYGVSEYYIITSDSEQVDKLKVKPLPSGARGLILVGQGDNYWTNASIIRGKNLIAEPNIFDKRTKKGMPSDRIQASRPTEVDTAASEIVYDSKGRRMLNLEWMNIPESEKANLRAKAEKLMPKIEEIKGETMTHDEVIRAAIEAELIKTGVSREHTLEMSARLLRLRQHVAAMAKTGTVTKEFIEALSVLNAQATNVARQLNSFKIGANPVYADIKIDLIKQLIKLGVDAQTIVDAAVGVDFTNQQQVTEFYRKFVKPNIQDILTEYRYINLLSSPLTHIVNTFSNMIQTLGLAPLTKAGTATVDVVHSLLTGKGREYYYSEVPAYYRGMTKAIPEALSGFFKALRGETFIERPDIARIPTNNKYLKPFYVIPRLLEASDVYFRTILNGGEFESLMSKVKNPTAEQITTMKEIAANKAAYYVFRGAVDAKNESGQGHLLTTIDNFTSKIIYPLRRFGVSYATKSGEMRTFALGSWFIPFVQTPMNIAKQMLEYSPAGVTTTWGAKNKTEQLGKALIGSLGTLVAATLVAMGNVTWAAPTDKKKKELFYATGRKPYSIRLGNNWYSFSRLGPIAMWFAIPAAMKWYMEEDPKSLTSTQMENMSKVAMSMSEFLADQTYLEGIGNFADFLRGDKTAVGRIATNMPSQLVPLSSLLRWTTNIIDPVFRETESGLSVTAIKENMMKQIPFLSKYLPAYEEPTGEESRRMRVNALSPVTISPNKPRFEMEYQGALAESASKGMDSYAKNKFEEKLDRAWKKGDKALVEKLRQEARDTMSALADKFEKKYSKEKMQGFRSLAP